MLYQYRDRSDSFIFIFGTVLGGAYEYICSVVLELVFGTVFWDYSKIPFNLGGRINLLYCFFWGIAAVVLSLIHIFRHFSSKDDSGVPDLTAHLRFSIPHHFLLSSSMYLDCDRTGTAKGNPAKKQ